MFIRCCPCSNPRVFKGRHWGPLLKQKSNHWGCLVKRSISGIRCTMRAINWITFGLPSSVQCVLATLSLHQLVIPHDDFKECSVKEGATCHFFSVMILRILNLCDRAFKNLKGTISRKFCFRLLHGRFIVEGLCKMASQKDKPLASLNTNKCHITPSVWPIIHGNKRTWQLEDPHTLSWVSNVTHMYVQQGASLYNFPP